MQTHLRTWSFGPTSLFLSLSFSSVFFRGCQLQDIAIKEAEKGPTAALTSAFSDGCGRGQTDRFDDLISQVICHEDRLMKLSGTLFLSLLVLTKLRWPIDESYWIQLVRWATQTGWDQEKLHSPTYRFSIWAASNLARNAVSAAGPFEGRQRRVQYTQIKKLGCLK